MAEPGVGQPAGAGVRPSGQHVPKQAVDGEFHQPQAPATNGSRACGTEKVEDLP